MTRVSASSVSGVTMTIERAVPGLTSSTSAIFSGSPVRHTMRVRPRSPTRSRIASSISTLSRLARIATHDLRLLWLASTSSATTVKTCSDQPSSTVWPCSTTRDRPLRSSAILPSSPVVITPISELTMKIPPTVARSISPRNGPVPVSSPIVPGSRVRSRLRQTMPGQLPLSALSSGATMTAAVATTTTSAAEARPSQPMSAGVPFDMVRSNQYRTRSHRVARLNRLPPRPFPRREPIVLCHTISGH